MNEKAEQNTSKSTEELLESLDDTSPVPETPEDHRSGFVGILGKPNVGKSTLLNAYLGEKIAIVTPKAQTTRDRILGIFTIPDRAQVIFTDTPGVHQPRHDLDEYMSDTASLVIEDSDVILFLADISTQPDEEDEYIVSLLREYAEAPVILVLNKTDIVSPGEIERNEQSYQKLYEFEQSVTISALQGMNRDKLLDMVVDSLPEGPLYYPADQITDQEERKIAAELVREQVLHYLSQEVPHSVAVQVDQFKQRENDLLYIQANIYVERDSQKGIVIGKGGKMLKRIGRAARSEMEAFFGQKVYLDLWVKVRKNWRKSKKKMRWLGYDAAK